MAQGLKRGPAGWRTFAEWFYPVQITMEYKDTPPDEKKVLGGLNFYRKTYVEDRTMHEFQTRLDPVFDLWKRGGAWDYAHPWMESVLPWDVTQNYIESVLADLEPQMLIGGHILLWPSSGVTSSIPWFMRPSDKFVMGFGILPAIPHKFLELILLELKRKGLLQSKKGKGGGYQLSKPPAMISVGEVIRVLDGPIALLPCVSQSAYRRCDECVDEIILPPSQRRRRSRNSQSLFDSLHARVGACS